MPQISNDKSFYQEYFKEVDSLHSLQVPPNEREWLLRLPNAESKPAKIVLYLGCNMAISTVISTEIPIPIPLPRGLSEFGWSLDLGCLHSAKVLVKIC